MDRTRMYHGLRFERAARAFPRRLIPIGLTIVVFSVLWWLVPPTTLFWLLLLLVVVLTWIASYGWRSAAAALHTLLHRLEGA